MLNIDFYNTIFFAFQNTKKKKNEKKMKKKKKKKKPFSDFQNQSRSDEDKQTITFWPTKM